MWLSVEMSIEVEDDELPTVLVDILTPAGRVGLLGEVRCSGDTLYIEKAHIDGLAPNVLGIAGLNAIGRKLLEEANVAKIVIKGATRTTGRGAGRVPLVIRFPRG
jgi:hypothetical protein